VKNATEEKMEEILASDDVFCCEDINDTNEISLGTLDKNVRNPDSTTLLEALNDIARQKSTNRLRNDNRTLSNLTGIKEKMILKTLKALQKDGSITLVYEKDTIMGGWTTCRTIVIN